MTTRLRNFNMSDTLYNAIEYIAEQNKRPASGEFIVVAEQHVKEYARLNKIPIEGMVTEKRKAKIKKNMEASGNNLSPFLATLR